MADLQTAFLMSMAVVIAVAAVIVVLFHRFRQPLILGYLLAGMVVGPIVTSVQVTTTEDMQISVRDIVDLLARLGIILLTFSIGLEFSFKQLRRIGVTVITAATLEILIMIGIGFQLGIAIGWTKLESSLLGAILSVASTMIIVRALRESGGLDDEKARLIVGLLVVEDFAAVLILAGVSGLISTGAVTPSQLGELVLKMGAFMITSVVFGVAIVPRLVDYVGRQRSNELMVITVLGLAFSMAYFARWIGFSEAIGSFVMGVIVSETKYLGDVVRRVEPIRDLFGAIFFITVGMLVNLDLFTVNVLKWVLIIAGVFVLAKMFACTFSTFICGFGARNSLGAGLSMIAIGEFSLMIAAVAVGSADIRPEIYPTIVLVTTITALVVPYSVKYTDKVSRALEGRTPRSVLYMASYLNLVVRNMRRRSRSSVHISNEMRNSITRLVVYIIVMLTAVALAVNTAPHADQYAYLVGGNEDIALAAIVAGTLVVVIFTLIGLWSRTVFLIHASVSEAILGTKSAESVGYETTTRALEYAILGFYVILGFVAMSPIIRPVIQQDLAFAIVTIVIIAVAIIALWGSAKTIDIKLAEIFEHREAYPAFESSRDLAEIEDIITAMERGRR